MVVRTAIRFSAQYQVLCLFYLGTVKNSQRFSFAINLHLADDLTLSSVCVEFLKNSGIANDTAAASDFTGHSAFTAKEVVRFSGSTFLIDRNTKKAMNGLAKKVDHFQDYLSDGCSFSPFKLT